MNVTNCDQIHYPVGGDAAVIIMVCANVFVLGTTVKDAHKREWVVGEPVGQGGFGMIYLCDSKGNERVYRGVHGSL